MSQTMKLSEAIRLGATVSHQIYGQVKDNTGGTCAWGSALLAIDRLKYADWLCSVPPDIIPREWFKLADSAANCPVSACVFHTEVHPPFDMECCIAHLNDDHRWTREAIADWVQTIEDQLEQSSSEAKAEQKEEQHVATFV